jgi:cell division protein ZapE
MTPPIISLDSRQKELVEILDKIIYTRVKSRPNNLLKKLVNRLTKPKENILPNSIYVYGGVGRGKTMIAAEFYNKIPIAKLFVHYQDFMKGIHESLHKYDGSSSYDILVNLAKDIAKKYMFICIDEFEVQDIADAMIISRLFRALKDYGVGLLITSNTPPDQLYNNGLQREQFMPFINMVKNEFIVFALNTPHDYRLDKIEAASRVLYPLNSSTTKKMNDVKKNITDGGRISSTTLEVFGRKIIFPTTYKTVLITDFDSLCKQNLASNDFIEICKYFTTVIIENIPYIGKDDTDSAIRFINFIDNIYFHKLLLFISLADSPKKIYCGGKKEKEFQRSISRLHEINSQSYYLSSKHQ